MAGIRLAALREAHGERRVAIVPDVAAKMSGDGWDVSIEKGAGDEAFFTDSAYADAGAALVTRAAALKDAAVLAVVNPPDAATIEKLGTGQVIIGMLGTRTNPGLAKELAGAGVTALDMTLLPRTLSRAQTMDALSSQASVAGYRAALVAAEAFSRYLPMMITAAGTAKPAKVLVLGAGVAGLQAIGTAKRLGAIVAAYDVRPASRGEVESLGATFLELKSVADAAGEGGYARELTAEEQAAQQAELGELIASYDIVITTAQVPGRKPPVLVTAGTVAAMAPGSVIVDIAASDLGGNVEGSKPGERVLTSNGVEIIGAGDLPSQMPAAASSAFAKNVQALAKVLLSDGELKIDLDDEVLDAVVVAHDGSVRGGQAPAPAAATGKTEKEEK